MHYGPGNVSDTCRARCHLRCDHGSGGGGGRGGLGRARLAFGRGADAEAVIRTGFELEFKPHYKVAVFLFGIDVSTGAFAAEQDAVFDAVAVGDSHPAGQVPAVEQRHKAVGLFLFGQDIGMFVTVEPTHKDIPEAPLAGVVPFAAGMNLKTESAFFGNPRSRFLGVLEAGDLDAARALQLKMIPVNQAVTAIYGVPGLKTAMDMRRYFGGDPRPPLLPSSEQERSEIEAILKKADLLK